MGAKICRKSNSNAPNHRNRTISVEADEVTGLTRGEKELLRNTWATMEKEDLILVIGTDLFNIMFEEHPEIMKFFSAFNEGHKLEMNQKFSTHALRVLAAVKLLLDHVDKPDVLMQLMKTLSQSHQQRNVTAHYMGILTAIFIKAAKINLQEKFSVEEERAWEKFFVFTTKTFVKLENIGSANLISETQIL